MRPAGVFLLPCAGSAVLRAAKIGEPGCKVTEMFCCCRETRALATKPCRAGREQWGEGHPKAQPRDSFVTLWLLLFGPCSARFIFLRPFIESDVKPFGLLRLVSVGAVPALPWIAFILCTRLKFIRVEHAARVHFRTGLKPSAVWKPAGSLERVLNPGSADLFPAFVMICAL